MNASGSRTRFLHDAADGEAKATTAVHYQREQPPPQEQRQGRDQRVRTSSRTRTTTTTRSRCSSMLSTSTTLVVAAMLLLALSSATAAAAATPSSYGGTGNQKCYDLSLRPFRGGASSDDGGSEGSAMPSAIALDRASFVRRILAQRFDYVQSGKRTKDIGKWIQSNGGDATIHSMHGIETHACDEDPDFTAFDYTENHYEIDEETSGIDSGVWVKQTDDSNIQLQSQQSQQQEQSQQQVQSQAQAHGSNGGGELVPTVAVARHMNTNDPFPHNRMNLDLVLLPDMPTSCYEGTPIHYSTRPEPTAFQLCRRAVQLGFQFAPVLSTTGLAMVSTQFRQNVWYRWFVQCLGRSGAAWIKWGQWSSTRNDMFPDALCSALESLHNDAPAHSSEFSRVSLESSLGLAPDTLCPYVFDEFDDRPLASGSIAQVHKAKLNGTPIAIKIRHPNVAQIMAMDFRLMGILAWALSKVPSLKWLHLRETISLFSHTMAAQADLHVEAHHLEILNHNFKRWDHVRFPQPVYASAACIVETFEPGSIVTSVIDKYDRLAEQIQRDAGGEVIVTTHTQVKNKRVRRVARAGGSTHHHDDNDDAGGVAYLHHGDRPDNDDDDDVQRVEEQRTLTGRDLIPTDVAKFLVTTGLGVYLKMLLVDNLMHADLHPGNIMINFQRAMEKYNVANKGDGRSPAVIPTDQQQNLDRLLGICLVDAGMVAQLTEDESSAFIGLLSSLGEGNGREAAEFTLQFSLENNMTPDEKETFVQDMCDLFAERCQGYGTGVDAGHVLRGILGLIRKHHVRIDANFATLVVNCLCIESLGRQVCPNYNVLDASEPLLRCYRKMCYDADGTLRPDRRKSRLVKAWLSFMYIKKNISDRMFFKREAKRNGERTISQRILLE